MDLEALRSLAEELRQIGYAPLLAKALHVVGLAEALDQEDPQAGLQHLEEAALAAVEGGDRPQQTAVYASLVKTYAQQAGDLERAECWSRFARAALESDGSIQQGIESS